MKKKNRASATEEDLLVELTFHNVPPSLLNEFSEKIVQPNYGGSLNMAIVNLMQKALSDQEFFNSHIIAVRN